MTKYQNKQSQRLHEHFDPDRQEGGGGHWLGLYESDSPGGIILHEDLYGFVTMEHFKTEGDLRLGWEMMCALWLPSQKQPMDDDFVIEVELQDPPLYSCRQIGSSGNFKVLLKAANEAVQMMNPRPSVYLLTPEGNFNKIDIQKELDSE